MTRYIHWFSALLFYVLGGGYFVGYLLHRNEIGEGWPLWFLSIADLPLALVAMLYGGTSLYLSTNRTGDAQPMKGILIALPLIVVFGVLFVLNYWMVLGLPVQEF